MAAPNSNEYGTQGWMGQPFPQRKPVPQRGNYSQTYGENKLYTTQQVPQQQAPYIAPYYHNNPDIPIIAELPAPPPPAPPTTTSDQQLKEDELLAHKIQQVELEEVRRRSSSIISQQQQSIHHAWPDTVDFPPLAQQQSTNSLRLQPTVSLRPHSQSLSSDNVPWGPASIGSNPVSLVPTAESDPLPEVVVGTHPAFFDDSPIPVASELLPYSTADSLDPTALSTYVEEHRQPPYPSQWRLSPVLATFYAYSGSKSESGTDWLTPRDTFTWRTIRPTEHAYNPAAPSYTFNFATKGGSYRDPRFSWTMIVPEDASDAPKKPSKSSKPAWSYELRLERSTGMRKTEVMHHGKDKAIFTTYVHAANYDSLRFIGPDGRAYMWVSSGRISSVNGARFDTNRNALFAQIGHIQDPLYGEIVADHTFWDGYVDESEVHADAKCDGCQEKPIKGRRWRCRTCHQHDVCDACRTLILNGGFGELMQQTCAFSLVCLPDEALFIRSLAVDQALIVATLQVLKDWQMHTIRQERKGNASGFKASEEAARRLDLGVMSYWKASDWDKKNAENEKRGTVVKARSIESVRFDKKTKDEPASALSNLVGAGFALGGPGYGTSGATDGASPVTMDRKASK